MYTVTNYPTKKALKDAVSRGERVELQAPYIGQPVVNGRAYVEGPHYPQPHRFYAQVQVKDGIVVGVK